MTTQEVANRLYELCRQNQFEQAQEELYADDATCTQPDQTGERKTMQGKEAIIESGRQFQNMIEEVHSGYTNEPMVFGNYIFMEMGIDVTMKGADRMTLKEMCTYEVRDGKIISEEFFF